MSTTTRRPSRTFTTFDGRVITATLVGSTYGDTRFVSGRLYDIAVDGVVVNRMRQVGRDRFVFPGTMSMGFITTGGLTDTLLVSAADVR